MQAFEVGGPGRGSREKKNKAKMKAPTPHIACVEPFAGEEGHGVFIFSALTLGEGEKPP